MTTVLWIIIAIFWTILVLIAGYASGVTETNKKRNLDIDSEPEWSSGVRGPAGPTGATGPQGPPGFADEERLKQHDRLWEAYKGAPGDGLVDRIKALEDRDHLYQDRFKRVEKKAGLNV